MAVEHSWSSFIYFHKAPIKKTNIIIISQQSGFLFLSITVSQLTEINFNFEEKTSYLSEKKGEPSKAYAKKRITRWCATMKIVISYDKHETCILIQSYSIWNFDFETVVVPSKLRKNISKSVIHVGVFEFFSIHMFVILFEILLLKSTSTEYNRRVFFHMNVWTFSSNRQFVFATYRNMTCTDWTGKMFFYLLQQHETKLAHNLFQKSHLVAGSCEKMYSRFCGRHDFFLTFIQYYDDLLYSR